MKFLNRYGWVLLAAVAAVFFARSFLPGMVLFSNDTPNAMVHADYFRDPTSVMGMWMDLNWAGISAGAVPLSGHTLLVFLLGPAGYSKFAGMLASIFLGWSGWFYFRRLGFEPLVSLLGGLALMLNMSFFCFTTWGVFAWSIALGYTFIVLGIIHQQRYTPKDILAAGLFTGLCVNDGTDLGAIMTALIGVYFIFRNVSRSPAALGKAAVQLAAIVVIALLVASNRVYSLVETFITPVVAEQPTKQDNLTGQEKLQLEDKLRKEELERWNFITQWSLPKKEAASFLVPGLFGYGTDTPDGGQYWGEIGRDPGWTKERGPNGARQSGGGLYLGKVMLLLALLTIVAIMVPKLRNTPLIRSERRELLFWIGVCLCCLVIIFGKYFFAFRLVYALPFFSSIRNPLKYIVPLVIGVVILFGHGLRLLTAKHSAADQKLLLKLVLGIAGVLVLVHVGLLGFWSGGRDKILGYLRDNAFDPMSSQAIFEFSQKTLWLSFVFLLITAALVIFCLRATSKPRLLLGLALLLIVDLGFADHYWIKYYDYQARYQSNPVLEVLRNKPYEHRVSGPQGGNGLFYLMAVVHRQPAQQQEWMQWISYVYYSEWLQHHFQYFNIQSPDIIQWPRVPIMDKKFREAFGPKVSADGRSLDIPATLRTALRFWELTNTRYLVASPPSIEALQAFFTNSQFRLVKSFDIGRNGDYYTAFQTTNGPLALIEFSNALPRVKVYSKWRVEGNEDQALAIVADPAFDPASEVIVVSSNDVPGIKPGEAGAASEARITGYTPKKYAVSATNAAPGVLLLNSRYDPNWRVTVDGQPQTLLRCNFLMSGVALPAGNHEVVFHYAPGTRLFYVNVVALAGLVALLVVPFGRRKAEAAPLDRRKK